MEMQGRIDEGIAFLESRENDWPPDNGFAFHNFWHLALFYLERGATTARSRSSTARSIRARRRCCWRSVDATAMLWRLHLEGVDVGRRFEQVADEWEAALDDEARLLRVQRLPRRDGLRRDRARAALRRLVTRMEAATLRTAPNAAMTRHVGLPLVIAVRTSPTATTPARSNRCCRRATSRSASAAAMRSATCSR